MKLFAQLTDAHLLVADPERGAQLTRAVDRLLAFGITPEVVLLTGDVADDAEPGAYAEAARRLSAIDAPLVVVPGNHDARAPLRAGFGLPGAPDDPVRSVGVFGGVRIIACDSSAPGSAGGELDLDWLGARLAEDRAIPTIVAMHHPPFAVGIAEMDAIGLPAATRSGLAELLRGAPNVLRVVAGHVHLACTAMLGGVPVCTAPSVNVQLAPNLLSGILDVNADPPGLALHVLMDDGQLVTHFAHVPRA